MNIRYVKRKYTHYNTLQSSSNRNEAVRQSRVTIFHPNNNNTRNPTNNINTKNKRTDNIIQHDNSNIIIIIVHYLVARSADSFCSDI